MLHKNIANSLREAVTQERKQEGQPQRLQLVQRRETASSRHRRSSELLQIASRRFSGFFAEAAVLVLVFGVLDFFLQKGHIEAEWVAGSLAISAALLLASVATEFSARKWLGAQP